MFDGYAKFVNATNQLFNCDEKLGRLLSMTHKMYSPIGYCCYNIIAWLEAQALYIVNWATFSFAKLI